MHPALVLLLAYLIGSIPSGYIIVRAKEDDDIRRSGSGGTGATNVSRRAGKGAGVMTLLFDAMKGALAVFVAGRMAAALFPYADWTIALAAVFAIVGHNFPVWLRFRGGKGVATCLGAFLVLAPALIAVALVTFALAFALGRFVSLASMVAVASMAITAFLLMMIDPLLLPITVAAILSAALVIFAHRENIQRLSDGTEPRFQ